MSILDALARRPAEQTKAVPQEVRQRVERGRKEMRKAAYKRQLCQLFLDGEQYAYLTTKGTIANQETARGIGGKPDHRVRNRYNFIRPMVDAKVSASTTRVPGYEVNPASTDPEDLAGARLAQKIIHAKYDTWRLRESRVKAATLAIGGGGAAFGLPYFDSMVGPFREVPDEYGNVEMVGEGEIKILILNGNEVFWEPGVDFYHSRWYGVEHARPISELMGAKDYIGPPKLQPNASTSLNHDKPTDDMVLVQMYFERPCPEYPHGRMLTMVNDQQVFPESPYPLRHRGQVIDEPCIHRLVYRLDPVDDDDLGLTWELIDFQRTVSDCVAGDTLVHTREGDRTAASLAGKTVDVLAGDGVYRPAAWESYGTRRLWRVELSDGSVTYATAGHEWVVRDSAAKNRRVRTDRLRVGARMPVALREPHQGVTDEADWLTGVRNGLIWGDGSVARGIARKDGTRAEFSYMRQYGDENCALVEDYFTGHHGKRVATDRGWGVSIQTYSCPPDMKDIPSADASHDRILGFIAGAIASDGCVMGNGAVVLTQSDREALERIAALARSVGIFTRAVRQGPLPNGYPNARRGYLLTFSKRNFVNQDGADMSLLLKPSHRAKIEATFTPRKHVPRRTVVSVEQTDRYEEVFCCDEPVTHTWALASLTLTGNCYNKCVELKSRALHLQLLAPTGSLRKPRTDEPGGVIYYNPVGGLKPEWERAPDPGILGQLQAILARTIEDMRYVAADTDVSAAPNVAADAVNAVIQQAANRWSQYISDMAAWDASVARHCLLLAQEHYTEDRLLRHRGRFGWEPVESFRGSDINGQVDVTVNPATVETRTRAAMLQTLAWIQANFPGYVRPEVAMEIAMYGQSLDSVIESFEFDKARVNEVIQRIRDGSVMEMPSRTEMVQGTDPETGLPSMVPTEVPGWMPREFDSIDVQMWVYTNWLKTPDAANLPPEMYEVAMLVYQGMRQLQDRQQAEAMAAQTAQAEQLGEQNAAKPQMSKPLPSTPAPS